MQEQGTLEPVCRFGVCQNPEPELSPDDALALRLFMASQGQWRYVGGGFGPPVPIGLDLPGVKLIADAMGIAWNWPLMRRLEICQQAALPSMIRRCTPASAQKPDEHGWQVM